MNSPRQQAYHQLIHDLLTCESRQEQAIVSAHPDLIDAELARLMEIEAANLEQRGEGEAASRLRNLAGQLFTPPNPSVSGEEQEIGVLFLMELLRATAESDANPEVVYPILVQNLDKVNDNLAQILREWATDTLAEADGQWARNKAVDIVNFSNLMQRFPLGSIASNREIAIAGYEVALRVLTREAFPQGWAMTQNNLGAAYRNRITGDRAENLETAIAAYQAALQVYTREAFPQDWAMTQNNLGNAYSDRITGDRAENLERAIAAYQAALQVYTREAFPQDWATTQNNLGAAYSDRITGDRAENLETAIAAYQAALQVYTREAFPKTGQRRKIIWGLLTATESPEIGRRIWKRRLRLIRRLCKFTPERHFPKTGQRRKIIWGLLTATESPEIGRRIWKGRLRLIRRLCKFTPERHFPKTGQRRKIIWGLLTGTESPEIGRRIWKGRLRLIRRLCKFAPERHFPKTGQ